MKSEFCETRNYFVTKICKYFGTWMMRRPLPVLHVSAGEDGGPGGFPNLPKEEEQEEDEEEKKEDDDDE